MRHLWNCFCRELGLIKESPRYLILLTAGILFSYVFFLTFMHEGQPENLPIAVVDQDGSYLSRRLCHEIDAMQGVDVVAVYNSHSEAREAMQRQEIFAFLEIPKGTYSEVLDFKTPHLALYSNNAYLLAGTLSYKTLSTIGKLTSAAVQREVMRKKGYSEDQIMGMIQPIEIDAHLISNPWGSYLPYVLTTMLPGIIGVMALLLTVYLVTNEYKLKTEIIWLSTAGGDMLKALIGKLLPYTCWFTLLGIVGNIVMFGFSHFVCLGSFFALSVTMLLFVMAMQSMGVLLAGLIPDQHLAVSIAAIYGMLSFSMSGFSYPVVSMPPALQAFSYIFPLRHYYLTYADVAMFGANFTQYWSHLCWLLCFLIAGCIGGLLLNQLAKSDSDKATVEC